MGQTPRCRLECLHRTPKAFRHIAQGCRPRLPWVTRPLRMPTPTELWRERRARLFFKTAAVGNTQIGSRPNPLRGWGLTSRTPGSQRLATWGYVAERRWRSVQAFRPARMMGNARRWTPHAVHCWHEATARNGFLPLRFLRTGIRFSSRCYNCRGNCQSSRGGIGRRVRLRTVWGNPWRFESSREHHLCKTSGGSRESAAAIGFAYVQGFANTRSNRKLMPPIPIRPDSNDFDTLKWPFKDPRNVGVFTTKFVMQGEPICFAYRDWEDGAWQFLPQRLTDLKDAMLVCLEEIYTIDPSIGDLADLPDGWKASRADRHAKWQRARNHPFPVFAEDLFYLEDATEYERLYPEIHHIPAQSVRENLVVGDVVKLTFRFADEHAARKDNECERMWVSVTDVDSDNLWYRGTLANDPLLHTEIGYGHDLWFHPMHVYASINQRKGS
jgi:hypothetical protein